MPHIHFEASEDGSNVVLNVTQPPDIALKAQIAARDIGHFVTGMLCCATDCAEITGAFAKLRLRETDPKKLICSNATEVAVADAPDAAVLIFAIGATELSIGIPKSALASIGQALLTVSAGHKQLPVTTASIHRKS